MTSQVWWYAARSSGIVSWAMLSLSVVWGLLLSTKTMKQTINRPWLLGVHRAFSGLSVIFVVVHVVALIADSYTHFDIIDALVPFASSWHPIPVAWGVVGLWMIIAIELTSLARKWIPKTLWRRVHFVSFALFIVATIHGLTAGTDTKTMLAILIAVFAVSPITLFSIVRIVQWTRAPLVATSPRIPAHLQKR